MVLFRSGAALALIYKLQGAFLFSSWWSSLRWSWVALGAAGSGRAVLGQVVSFRFFWAALFAPKVAAWILPQHTKTNGFRAIYAEWGAR